MLFIVVKPEIIAVLIVLILYVYICSYVTSLIPKNLILPVSLILAILNIPGIGGLTFILTTKTRSEAEVYAYAEIALYLVIFLLFSLPPALMVWSMGLRNKSQRNRKTHKQLKIAATENPFANPEIQVTEAVYDYEKEEIK